MNKQKILLVLCIFLILFSIKTIAQTDQLGCCTNPGAGFFTCSADRLVFLNKECCPTPEANFSSYYKSAQNPFNPNNFADCSSNFFVQNKVCSEVDACSLGCCCSGSGGTIKPEAQCKGTGLTFFKGQIDCASACPTPQCGDGIDNDNNGCADFGSDTGCGSAADADESGGNCILPGANCNDPSYVPKLSSFEITPAKGQKKFFLEWRDECKANSLYYEIFRCEGIGCTNFVLLGAVNTNSFTDSTEELEFSKIYTYEVKAYYSLQSATPTAIKTATLGDFECLNKLTTNFFCINNSGYYCNAVNKLTQEGTKCPSNQVCIISSNKPSCFNKQLCNYRESNPFGLFYTQKGCEDRGYCFYDKSHSTIDSCFSCDPSMACYDYKTGESCKKDNCNMGNCQWKILSAELQIGACVNTAGYNCEWCDKSGTPTLENARSYNQIFDFCTKEKSNALSQGNFKCYFKSGKSVNCDKIACADYSIDQCSNAQITHDNSNNIVNPSPDECGIKVCQNINNVCVKNADGDNKADCNNNIACEKDYFAPETALLQISQRGIVDSIAVQIYDKTSANSSSILKTTANYTTFLCLEPCSFNGHPYNISTQSRRLIVSNLYIFDSDNGNKLLTLNEGVNSVLYFSQDPSKNIGLVKSITIEAHRNTTGPKVFSINVTDGAIFYDKIFTSNPKPNISVRFYEPAIVTFARLMDKKTGYIASMSFTSQLNDLVTFTLTQPLPEGEYTFELNAKNNNNIFMQVPFVAVIVIDNSLPEVNVTPSNGVIVNSSQVTIRLSFNKDVKLDKVTLNSADITGLFSTINNKIFLATLNLSDGNKVIEIYASDFAKHQVSKTSSFIIDSEASRIIMLKPTFGVASGYIFDIIVASDNNAVCRYSFDNNFEYSFMDNFTSTGATSHKILNFDEISSGDTRIHKLYVRCKDQRGESFNSFDLSVDTTAPSFNKFFVLPNPVVEDPPITTFTIEANELVRCKYSNSATVFSAMAGKFQGFDDEIFRTINRQNITLAGEGDFRYYVACENKAEIASDVKDIAIKVDYSIPMSIISHTNEFFNSTSVFLSVETNKISQCQYSETESTAKTGTLFGAPGYFHTRQITASSGKHTLYVICKDQFLQKYSDVVSITFTVDTTPPNMVYVNDTSTLSQNPEKSCLRDRLRVKFFADDEESKIKEYYYSIVKRSTSQLEINVTKTTNGGNWLWVNNLNLENGSEYFFVANAKNFAGFDSEIMSSDGITIDMSACDSLNLTCKDRGDCVIGESCNSDYDCGSKFCYNNRCKQPTCGDIIKNQDESDVDCGGSCSSKCQYGKSCKANADCQTSFCSFGTCTNPDPCGDGKLTTGESDVDCGGSCQTKCSEGSSCTTEQDCESGLECTSSRCKSKVVQQGAADTDGDGLPDEWELQNGLNPNDPNDASLDLDQDGLTNLEEYGYINTYSQALDPNNSDTDGDGFSDKEEIDRGTDPTNREDFPKSNKTKIILFIFGIVILIAGFGYLAYVKIGKRKEAKYGEFTPRQIQPRQSLPMQREFKVPQQQMQQVVLKPRQDEAKIREALKTREEKKTLERKELFRGFEGRKEAEVKAEKPESIEGKKTAEIKPKKQRAKKKIRKPKEDVFAKLKEIAKGTKKGKSSKRKNATK